MTHYNNMSLEEMLQEVLLAADDNPLRKMLEFMVQKVLEYEMSEHIEAAPYERTEGRTGQRNGYKPRMLITRVGTLNLLVPQARDGSFSTSLFEKYQRSEKALVVTFFL
jgi:putative transposase